MIVIFYISALACFSSCQIVVSVTKVVNVSLVLSLFCHHFIHTCHSGNCKYR